MPASTRVWSEDCLKRKYGKSDKYLLVTCTVPDNICFVFPYSLMNHWERVSRRIIGERGKRFNRKFAVQMTRGKNCTARQKRAVCEWECTARQKPILRIFSIKCRAEKRKSVFKFMTSNKVCKLKVSTRPAQLSFNYLNVFKHLQENWTLKFNRDEFFALNKHKFIFDTSEWRRRQRFRMEWRRLRFVMDVVKEKPAFDLLLGIISDSWRTTRLERATILIMCTASRVTTTIGHWGTGK